MVDQYRRLYEQKIGQKNLLKEQLKTAKQNIKSLKSEMKVTEKAQAIIQLVAKQTQSELTIQISNIITLALNSIFDDPYKFQIEFVEKRGKTEADIYLTREGNRVDPMFAAGGGVVDVASFALRIALWSLKKANNTIILDEPFKFLSRDLQPKASKMMKELSYKLGIQFIIVTHDKALIEEADKVFSASIINKKTEIKEEV